MNIKSFCVSLVLTGAATSAAATDWHRVGKVDGVEVFIDRASIRYDRGTPLDKEGDRRKVHVLYSHATEQRDVKGGRFFSETFVDEISCSKRTLTTLSSIHFAGRKGDGAVVQRHKMTVRVPQPIGPGTLNEHLLEMYVCDIG